MHFILSTLLFFGGLATALSVLTVNLVLMARDARDLTALLYVAVSFFFGGSLVYILARQGTGVECAQASVGQLLLFGALTVLHLLFLWDSLRRARKKLKSTKGEGQ